MEGIPIELQKDILKLRNPHEGEIVEVIQFFRNGIEYAGRQGVVIAEHERYNSMSNFFRVLLPTGEELHLNTPYSYTPRCKFV